MPEISEFQPGLPSWVDLSTPKPDESASFYGQVLGWTAEEAGDPEEYGGYRIFLKDAKQVGGLMKIQQEGQPPSWNVYITVSDANETAEKVKEAGGEVIVEPMDVADQGRMAFFADPTGAAFGIWQAKEQTGAGGLFRMGDDSPEEVPAHWIVYFAVEHTDAATESAKEGGAQVRSEPFDTEAGRIAVMTDPHGAAFALIAQGPRGAAGEEGDEE
jgi:uncharacterized protein